MTESVIIKRPAGGKTATGAPNTSASPSTIATVACRRRDLEQDEKETADQLEPVRRTEFLMPYNTDVRAQDQLTIGSDTWEVVSPPEIRSLQVQVRCVGEKARA